MTATIFIPGFGNSLGQHWQNQWFKKIPNGYWLEQENWVEPDCNVWVESLQASVRKIKEPIIFISHGLGGLTLVEWAKVHHSTDRLEHDRKVLGAFMVAITDPLQSNAPSAIRGYAKYPLTPLPFPSKMVASTNDPYCNVRRSEFFAKSWGSDLELVGAKGHISGNLGLGDWSEGVEIFQQWRKKNNI